jgi:signal transduction histidine kinase/ActR/RegA family two-component response regulator
VSRQGRILVVEDDQRWKELLRKVLQRGGFYIDTAATVVEALQRLEETFYHLLLLDIRMADMDASDVGGMDLLHELAKQDLTSAIPVIMHTAYGTARQIRTAFVEYDVADFLDKSEFDDLEFLGTVRKTLTQRLRINLTLDIHWQDTNGAEEAVLNLAMPDGRIKRGHPMQQRVAAELDDLLCRLFHQAEGVMARPLTPDAGGAGVLWVQPFYASGGGQSVVIKFGGFRNIDREYRNFKAYVESFIGLEPGTHVEDLRRTPLLGGILYSLVGTAGDRVLDFGTFYREADVPQIRTVLDHLFLEVTGSWYASRGTLQPLDLTSDYQQLLGFTFDKLEPAVSERLKSVQGRSKLRFRDLPGERTFTNPILDSSNQHLVRKTYLCTTHGNLNENNILVDDAGHTWLIDFERAGPGHILRDIATLDSVVRFHLLGPEEADLVDRLRMEEALCSADRFSRVEEAAVSFSTENTALAKAYATAIHLRSLARRLLEPNPSDDISELYIALLYHALNTLRFYWLSTVQLEHALLSASLLVDAIQGVYAKRVEQLEVGISELDWLSKQRFEFLSTASHELSRPLGHIKPILEDALAGQYGYLSPELKHRLERALESTNHELDLIKRMFDLTSLEAGKVEVQLGPCNVLDCIRVALEENRARLHGKGLKLVEQLPQTGIMVSGDSLFLTRVFSNVLDNAVKFTEKGEVGIRCAQIGDWVQTEVWDTGIGISSDKLPHISDPYFQADRSLARRYPGLGAGLYLVKKWLQVHGGTIEVESKLGFGSTFRIRLPIHSQITPEGTGN